MNELDDDELKVDLTPLIDVIFMLVIFFIMTMSFTLPVVDFNLPQSTTAQAETRTDTIRISVSTDGSYSFDQTKVTNPADLPELIKQRQAAVPEGTLLSLELVIDAAAPAQHIITVADLARQYTGGRLMVVSTRPDTSSAPATTPEAKASAQAAASKQP